MASFKKFLTYTALTAAAVAGGIAIYKKFQGTAYDNTPENFGNEIKILVDAGATILGGCCGTSPDYIKEVVGHNYVPSERAEAPKLHYLTSERKTNAFGLDDAFFVIGERINPTGKKKLQAELREGNMERVFSFAEEQEEQGAKVLDVNFGMSGIDEKAMMCRAIDELQNITNLPLCIDTSHVDVMEAALRRYPGRALINSISMESEKVKNLLPIAKKYGAMFILLPLSDKGLPESLDEKIGLNEDLLNRAYELGFTKEDIVVDGLVTTVGANKKAGVETLETIRYCKENGLATTCGLSNLSFGLPERGFINSSASIALSASLSSTDLSLDAEIYSLIITKYLSLKLVCVCRYSIINAFLPRRVSPVSESVITSPVDRFTSSYVTLLTLLIKSN